MKKFAIAVSSLAVVLGAPCAAYAQADAVAHATVGSSQVTVTQADITSMLKSFDPQVRQQLAADPKKLDEVVRSRLAVEAVLAEAHSKGWEKQPNVQALIDASRREVILRSYLASVSVPPADYPSDADIETAYQKNQSALMMPRAMRISQIYIAVPPGADSATVDKARARATDLAHQVHGKGSDFAALAKADSDDKASAANGGDMGFVPDPLLLPQIRQVADGMKPGDVAGPIQTPAGFHLIKLTDMHPAGVAPLAAVKERLRAELRQQRAQQDAQAYMAKLVASSGATLDEAALQKALAAVQ